MVVTRCEEVERRHPGGCGGGEVEPGVPARPLAVQQLHHQVEHYVQQRVAQQHAQQVRRDVRRLSEQSATHTHRIVRYNTLLGGVGLNAILTRRVRTAS